MSLISIQNFLAPFRSKTHLVTLIIVAAVFGAFRLSGGAITSTPRMSRKNVTQPTYNVQQTRKSVVVEESYEEPPVQVAPTKRATTTDSLLDSIDDRSSASSGTQKAKEDLSEIERKLGLR